MNYSFLSLIPPIAAIFGAAITKRIIPSLVIGLLAGTLIKTKTLLGTFIQAGDYLSGVVANKNSVYIILFLFCFGALAEIFKVGGGISGFAKKAEPYVKTERDALLSVWAASPATFLDCCFHVISTGTISKPLIEKVNGSRDKLAFIINTTSSQLIVLIPFATTYVGYILGVLSSSMARAGIKGNPYNLYLSSLYLNFYSIIILLISLAVIFVNLDFLKILRPAYKKDFNDASVHNEDEAHHESAFAEKVPPRILNLLIPLFFLIAMIFFLFWWTGRGNDRTVWEAITNATFEKSIFVATFTTLVLTTILYVIQKVPLKEIESNFLSGGTEFLPPIIVLILAWSISDVTSDLGFNSFIKGLVSTSVAPQLIPVIVFLIGGLASYFMGSSWGTWALVMPVGVALAVTTGGNLPLTIGAVLAGGSIGDNISPLGETPVLTAAITEQSVTEHIHYVLPYGIVAFGISVLLYLVVGYII